MFSALKSRDYRLLFAGQSASSIGDQFHLIALPWLVLTLTRDPLQLGLVLAAAGIPRAALMLATGIGNGYIGVVLMSSVQRLTDERFLGRVMSLIMLAVVGLMPISQAAAGVVLGASPTALFLISGAGFALLALAALVNRSLWTIQGVPTASESGEGLPRGAVTIPA